MRKKIEITTARVRLARRLIRTESLKGTNIVSDTRDDSVSSDVSVVDHKVFVFGKAFKLLFNVVISAVLTLHLQLEARDPSGTSAWRL